MENDKATNLKQTIELEDENPPIIDAEIVEDPPSSTDEFAFTPFNAPVKERPYTKSSINPDSLLEDIPEATFDPPSFEDIDSEEPASEPKGAFNEQFNDLGKKEKAQGAEMIADVCIDGYSKLKNLMGNLATISERKLDKDIAEGLIDEQMQIPVSENQNIPLKNWVQAYNQETKEAFSVDDDFVEKIKPPLVRIFEKRAIGLTDEQLVGYYLITDAGSSLITAMALRKNSNEILKNLREQTSHVKNSPPPPPPPSSPPPPNQPAKTEYREPEEAESLEVVEHIVPQKPKESNEFADTPLDETMPDFGNRKVLAEMEKIANTSQK